MKYCINNYNERHIKHLIRAKKKIKLFTIYLKTIGNHSCVLAWENNMKHLPNSLYGFAVSLFVFWCGTWCVHLLAICYG